MTGSQVPAKELHAGQVIHLEPHKVWGRVRGHREVDVLVTSVYPRGALTGVEHCGCPNLLGSGEHACGITFYEPDTPVLVIGEAA